MAAFPPFVKVLALLAVAGVSAQQTPQAQGGHGLRQQGGQEGKGQGEDRQEKQDKQDKQDKEYKEHEVKAAFLVHFLRYVEWPKTEADDAPFVLAVVGKSPFGSIWKDVDGKPVEGTRRKLVVREFAEVPKPEELRACHLLFVCTSEHERLEAILKAVEGQPVLTVTEGERMVERGVTLGLVRKDKRVLIEMNTEAARRARLKVSAQLQRVVSRRI